MPLARLDAVSCAVHLKPLIHEKVFLDRLVFLCMVVPSSLAVVRERRKDWMLRALWR